MIEEHHMKPAKAFTAQLLHDGEVVRDRQSDRPLGTTSHVSMACHICDNTEFDVHLDSEATFRWNRRRMIAWATFWSVALVALWVTLVWMSLTTSWLYLVFAFFTSFPL